MKEDNNTLNIEFAHSKKRVDVTVAVLTDSTQRFLENFASARFTTPEFAALLGDGSGADKFSNLLKAVGMENNPYPFFSKVLDEISQGRGTQIELNGVVLPSMMLVSILEQVIPGNGYVTIRKASQLESEANFLVKEEDRDALQEVIEKYPVRLSRHTIRQMMVSRDVAYQYMPFVEELDAVGFVNTWIGQFHDGLLEQMYQNRVIFLLNMSCPVYCRFCFRKHKDSRNEANPTPADVAKAVDHVKQSPAIKEIVVTGGDPFMNRKNMAATIDGLSEVEHVQALRLASRSVAYYPDLFLKDEAEYLTYLKEKKFMLERSGKRMELATHFIHPDEVSPEALDIISNLVKSGVSVYIQTPFLSECNDEGPELVKLFGLLRGAGAEIHYIYIPCSPIHGNSIYWKPLSGGIETAAHLRAHLSDRAIPTICTATPIGKMDWFTSGWAVERVKDNDSFLWFRTPYTLDFFKSFAPLKDLSNMRLNNHGTLDIQYMAKIGNEDYLLGERPPKKAPVNDPVPDNEIEMMIDELSNQCQTARSIVETGVAGLFRLHETRVEIGPDAGTVQMNYIKADARITDVVISAENSGGIGTDAIDHLHEIARIVKTLREIDHVTSARLRSPKLCTAPKAFSRDVIHALGDLNHLSVSQPLRLEIETWCILPRQITPEHKLLVRRLNNKGITVYCNAALLGGVNDNDEIIHQLAHEIRATGMEFHHVYVAGLPIQEKWNQSRPIDSYDVVDIATKVRREGSGREIPRYMFFTRLGEADYGLNTSFIRDPGNPADAQVKVKLDCYDLSYFKGMEPGFTLPEGIDLDGDCPVASVPGMIKTNDFAIS
ncbi:MAG: radical SAM protein [Desulfobacteraceae bacterium]|nr:MAG: radical SAM protein [Desulfobacteraceae bacterium]